MKKDAQANLIVIYTLEEQGVNVIRCTQRYLLSACVNSVPFLSAFYLCAEIVNDPGNGRQISLESQIDQNVSVFVLQSFALGRTDEQNGTRSPFRLIMVDSSKYNFKSLVLCCFFNEFSLLKFW